ncbi:MAG: 1-deoxy-D-xylulose-5-phosphate reductoisomerase [Actinomycetales bacterium]|nr:1-deoxy-D-xylulose-5-phosphate reductoisomerase [Actinomycetales bacterium]
MEHRRVVILGATGSIGTQALDIVRQNPELFSVVGLGAGGSNLELLAKQVVEFSVPHVAIADESGAQELTERIAALLPDGREMPTLLIGAQAIAELATLDCDVVLNGITGAAGLLPTVAALKAGHHLALANKESLVIGGRAVTSLAKTGQIVPVDSEHSALAQCLWAGTASEVRKLILTASGGPFRNANPSDLEKVTAEQALNHPTWSMGPVVTINSSTMFNKGLELIEAHLLFDIPIERIEVVIHPQSIVHSMVEFVDGSTIAQASPPDMHIPIALGLGWPHRVPSSSAACDWSAATSWTFEPVNHSLFPAINLAKKVGQIAGTLPAAMNAANEVAVAAFLAGQIQYLDIMKLVNTTVEQHLLAGFVADEDLTVESVTLANQWASEFTKQILQSERG